MLQYGCRLFYRYKLVAENKLEYVIRERGLWAERSGDAGALLMLLRSRHQLRQNMHIYGAEAPIGIYLEELHSNDSEHELEKVGNQHDIANCLNGYYHTFDYVLVVVEGMKQTKQSVTSTQVQQLLYYRYLIYVSKKRKEI